MPNLSVDFTNVTSGFEKIEPGNYLARVEKIESKMSQAGKPYLNWMFKIQGGDYDGRTAFFMTSLAPNALWKLKQVLIAAFDKDEEDLKGQFELDTDELIGEECTLIIGEEEYNGEMRDRVLDVKDAALSDEVPSLV